MIVKNEEDVLGRCLKSCDRIFDEIIIVDTGSSDRTIEIAKQFTGRVYKFEWIDDFSAARNFAFSKATGDYIMWLDADDVLLKKDHDALLKFKEEFDPRVDAVMLKYNIGLDDKGRPLMTYYRERIVRRSGGFYWNDPVHEYMVIHGHVVNADIAVTHKKVHPTSARRNLDIYLKMLKEGKQFTPRNTLYFARELSAHGMNDKAAEQYEKFLSGDEGWVEDQISACFELSYIHQSDGEDRKMLQILLRSFLYTAPRAEICCRIGEYFLNKNDFNTAVFWYTTALNLEKPQTWGFMRDDFWDFVPAMQLCVCYDRMGNREKAYYYHQYSKRLKPDSPSVAYNDRYFSSTGTAGS